MAKKLARTVHLTNPETRRVEVFTAGEVPPKWAADQISNDAAWGEKVARDVADAAEGGAPAKSASKDEWVAYAVSQGADEVEADAATKDDLIALYGG